MFKNRKIQSRVNLTHQLSQINEQHLGQIRQQSNKKTARNLMQLSNDKNIINSNIEQEIKIKQNYQNWQIQQLQQVWKKQQQHLQTPPNNCQQSTPQSNSNKQQHFDDQSDKLLIIEDSDQHQIHHNNLQTIEDYGEINSVGSSSYVIEDYEDTLIKQTLTKENYKRVGYQIGEKKKKIKKKIFQKIKKINYKSVQQSIDKDLTELETKKLQLQNQQKYLQQKVALCQLRLQSKQQKLKYYQIQYDKLSKVIEYIFYHGDKINKFQIDTIYTTAIQ